LTLIEVSNLDQSPTILYLPSSSSSALATYLALSRILPEIKQTTTPFLLLALDLPPPPLFQDAVEKNIIPQVALSALLAKYDGKTTQEFAGQLKRFRCTRLPPYIILHYKRFMKNNFVEEKNPTIVNFPISGVDFSQGEAAFKPVTSPY
jgi:hypothetical protein